MLLPTSLVGSYPQPDWLIDRSKLAAHRPPRVRARRLARGAENLWSRRRTTPRCSRSGTWNAAGIDTITDGEIRRESYSNRFATALDGRRCRAPRRRCRPGRRAQNGAAHRRAASAGSGPVEVRDVEFLRAHTDRVTKITRSRSVHDDAAGENEAYDDPDELVIDFAAAVNEETRAIARRARTWSSSTSRGCGTTGRGAGIAVAAIDRALAGLTVRPACTFASATRRIVRRNRNRYEFLGSSRLHRPADLDRGGAAAARPGRAVRAAPQGRHPRRARPRRRSIETPEQVAERIRAALAVRAGRATRRRARLRHEVPAAAGRFAKLEALSAGAAIVRREIAGGQRSNRDPSPD